MSAGADQLCQVAGCDREGSFGRRKNLANWREGYLWWCGDHRHLMPAVPVIRAASKPTLDKGGQGRLTF